MSKIYVFGIGGTGSRVMRALTMLLASGVECKADTIVPIIIDPDAAGGDVERTATLMRHYIEVRNNFQFSAEYKNRFLRTEIREIMTNFNLPLRNIQDCLFDEYINVTGMTKNNRALAEILFSRKNLNADMQVGFKGNPNIGSVVLNQFEESDEFLNFANEFTADDKIFIISSIFGGTGASGFPLLLKTLRNSNSIANFNLVNNAHIGAVTVLPYFKVRQDSDSQIDSATFVSKAKSALSYYDRCINNDIDNLYYVGDDTRATTYENHEGGTEQKNNAHFVEMVAALSLIDFANSDRPGSTVFKEYGIEEDSNEIIFKILGPRSKALLDKPMTQFMLFAKYMDERSDFFAQPWAKDRGMDRSFFDGAFSSNLKRNILDEYRQWIVEVSKQDRAFTPFHIHRDSGKLFDLVKGVSPKRVASFDSNFALFDNRLNATGGSSKTGHKEQQLVELFYQATQKLVKEKFNIA